MNYVLNQNWKVREETLVGFISVTVKTTLRRLRYFKMTLPLLQVIQKSLPILYHFVTHSREYCEWLCELSCHIQVGRLPFQGTWLSLVAQSVI